MTVQDRFLTPEEMKRGVKMATRSGIQATIGPVRICLENISEDSVSIGETKSLSFFVPKEDILIKRVLEDCVMEMVTARLGERLDYGEVGIPCSLDEKGEYFAGWLIHAMPRSAWFSMSKGMQGEKNSIESIKQAGLYAGMWAYLELLLNGCYTDVFDIKRPWFEITWLQKYKDDDKIKGWTDCPFQGISVRRDMIVPAAGEESQPAKSPEEVPNAPEEKHCEEDKSEEQKPNSSDVFLPLSLGGLFNRNHFERMLEHYGADNPSKLSSALRAYSTLSVKLHYYKSRDYDKEMCEELLGIFKKDVKFWNSLVDKGLRFYQGTKRLLSPSYMLGFVALWVLEDSAEEHCVFDYLGQITGKTKAITANTKELLMQLKKHHRRYGQFPSEDLQDAIMEGWLKFYDEQYKLREAK